METQGRPMLLGVRINLKFHIPHFTIGYLNAHQVIESRVQNIKPVVLDNQKSSKIEVSSHLKIIDYYAF